MNGLPVQRIDVNLGARSYPIHIGAGVMEQTPELDRVIPGARRAAGHQHHRRPAVRRG